MTSPHDIVFLVDCDNTLLDNDRVQADLRGHLAREFGADSRDRYWTIFEELRSELGYADYLGALQRYRLGDMNDPRLLLMSSYLVDYPFADRLYEGSLAAIAHLRRLGRTVILSDGDVVFQPRKIQQSGLWEAVDGHVLIYIHKERMLDAVAQRVEEHRGGGGVVRSRYRTRRSLARAVGAVIERRAADADALDRTPRETPRQIVGVENGELDARRSRVDRQDLARGR
jgi:hypothetical protein